MGRIAVLCPTRNKPDTFAHCVETFRNTSTQADLFYYVADDDPAREEYLKLGIPNGTFGPPVGFSRGVNGLSRLHPNYDMYMRCEDDFEFLVAGWDEQYLALLPPDGIGLVWCNYVLKGGDAEPHTAAVGAQWIEALGYFSIPGVKHCWCDNALRDLGEAIGRLTYIREPLIAHRHNPSDPRKDQTPYHDTDKIKYLEWRNGPKFMRDVNRLKEAMNGD